MDIEPIYCAEQIVVPPDLADILKAYTKEVIRRQPQDLLEFSAIYFGNLANVARSVAPVTAPTLDQLQMVFARARDEDTLNSQQLEALCHQAGLSKDIMNKAIDGADLDPLNIDVYKFIFVLISMSCTSFAGLVEALIEVCGENSRIETPVFLRMLQYVKPVDPEINNAFIEELQQSLEGLSRASMSDLMNDPLLKPKLAVV